MSDATRFSSRELATGTRALLGHITDRGGAVLGDKTVVDVITPVVDVLESRAGDSADVIAGAALAAARSAVDEGRGRTSKRGRAGWIGERSVGHPDPGSLAFLRLVEDITQDL